VLHEIERSRQAETAAAAQSQRCGCPPTEWQPQRQVPPNTDGQRTEERPCTVPREKTGHCSDSKAANGPMQCKRQCKKRKKGEELGHTKNKETGEEMEGMGWWAKSRCACGCSPSSHAASTRGMKCVKRTTDSGRTSAKRNSRNNREFVISPRQRRTFAKEEDREGRDNREDRDDVLEPLYVVASLD
jgi:hypothetical protein